MCYLCKEPVKDYTHFYGQGGAPDKTRPCPLWTKDIKKLHEKEVAEAVAKAKEEMKNKKKLTVKNDPTPAVADPIQGSVARVAPDVAEVLGVPRVVEQQQQPLPVAPDIPAGFGIPQAVPEPAPLLNPGWFVEKCVLM